LCTTPPELLNAVDNVLALYDSSRSRATMAGEAAALMSPEARPLAEACVLLRLAWLPAGYVCHAMAAGGFSACCDMWW
jgi:hypothetical protein